MTAEIFADTSARRTDMEDIVVADVLAERTHLADRQCIISSAITSRSSGQSFIAVGYNGCSVGAARKCEKWAKTVRAWLGTSAGQDWCGPK